MIKRISCKKAFVEKGGKLSHALLVLCTVKLQLVRTVFAPKPFNPKGQTRFRKPPFYNLVCPQEFSAEFPAFVH